MTHAALVAESSVYASADSFREGLRQLPGGVSIVTAGRGELVSGMTVSSWPLIESLGIFAANVLAFDHASLADRFGSGRGVAGPRRFEKCLWTVLSTGAPVLREALAAFDCEVERIITHHSHSIVLGRVVSSSLSPGKSGLAYWNGRYVAIENEDDVRQWDVCFPLSRGPMEI